VLSCNWQGPKIWHIFAAWAKALAVCGFYVSSAHTTVSNDSVLCWPDEHMNFFHPSLPVCYRLAAGCS